MKVFILGGGKVGRAFARTLRTARIDVTLRPARRGVPTRPIDADIIVLALRDRDLGPVAADLASSGVVCPSAVVVHAAGALPAEAIAALRPVCRGVAQMHPMISFASKTSFPTLSGGHCHIKGDPIAEHRARALARRLGMTPRTFARLDTVGYHAAAGLVANGAAALAAVGQSLLVASGVPRADTVKMLGPLLRSVAENVERLGFPDALTGPVRRGDAAGIARQIDVLEARVPEALPLYRASGIAQLPLARAIGDAPQESFDAVEKALTSPAKVKRGRRRRANR